LKRGATAAVNWKETRRRQRGQRGQRNARLGMARLRTSTQGTAVLGQGEPQGVLPTAVRTVAAANDEPRHGTSAAGARPGHGGRDAEATAQRQFSKRTNGQGSTERCRAQPLATRTRDPARPRPQRGQGKAGRARAADRARRVGRRGEQQRGRAHRRAAARQMVRTRGACARTAPRAQPSAAVAQARAAQRAGKPTGW